MSIRASVLSPQLGTHTLPNAAVSPEHGFLPTVIVAAILFVFTSSRWMALIGPFATHSESSVSACQSGVPLPASKIATGVTLVISRLTPGVLTPGGGGRL